MISLDPSVLANSFVSTAVLSSLSTSQWSTSLMQAPPPTAIPSVAQVEASMSQAPVPASQMLSLQQVEAQQAAQQLLQGQQQQQPSPAADQPTPASVQSGSVLGAGPSEAADAGESSQVRDSCWASLCQCCLLPTSKSILLTYCSTDQYFPPFKPSPCPVKAL